MKDHKARFSIVFFLLSSLKNPLFLYSVDNTIKLISCIKLLALIG